MWRDPFSIESAAGLPRYIRVSQHRARADFERLKPLLERPRGLLDSRGVRVRRHVERLADDDRGGRERLRNVRAIPALQGPVPAGLDVERHDRVAGDLRQPDGAW